MNTIRFNLLGPRRERYLSSFTNVSVVQFVQNIDGSASDEDENDRKLFHC